MSTKTTFKRIALVAVAALGFGMLSVVPSQAAADTAVSSFTTNADSFTGIGAGYVVAEINTFGNVSGKTLNLVGETITATVVSGPKTNSGAFDATDIAIEEGTASWSRSAGTVTSGSGDNVLTSASYSVDPTTDKGGDAIAAVSGGYVGSVTGKGLYFLSLASTTEAIDAGEYTVRIDLQDVDGLIIQRKLIKVSFISAVSELAGSVTVTVTGPQPAGSTSLLSTTQNVTVQLKDANGGIVRTGNNAKPTLTAKITDSADTILSGLTLSDSAYVATVNPTVGDGIYHLTAQTLSGLVAGSATISAGYGILSGSADLLLTGDGGNYIKTTVTATGKVLTTGSTVNYDLPLTTKSATVKATVYTTAGATVPVADATVYYTLAYDATYCVSGDMTPTKKSVPTKIVADANGVVTIDIANANPLSGCTATVTFSGGTVATDSSLARVLTWSKPVPTSVTVSPTGNYSAVLASTHKVTWTILDQFSTPVSGSTVTFTAAGANAPTAGVPSVISDAAGQVSYSWTDAAGVVDSATKGFDSIELKAVGTTSFVQGKRTVTYVTTLPSIASLYATYSAYDASATPVAVSGTVPTTTNIGGTTGISVSAADQINTGLPISTPTIAANSPWVKLNFQARKAAAITGTTGVPTVITVTGAKLLDGGKLVSTMTAYANDDVYVLGTTTGVATVTATNGTITSKATINFVNAAADARVLKLTEASGLVTASVTDAFGNGVKGVDVDVVGTGGAWLGNGATSASFKTATDGTVTFSVTGSGTVSASLSSTYTKASFLAGAGNATGTVVTTGAPAGVRSASVATSGYNVTADAAQGALDAAAEATDAANAATDAANAAAEAADAATAAAQDAADAVAALSTQVSEMIDALKKQITALTNLVIKIQKKVKA